MNRYSAALTAGQSNAPLRLLAETLLRAVIETEVEGQSANNDPAVMLLVGFISFMCHADVSTPGTYRQLVEVCEQRSAPLKFVGPAAH